MPSKNKLSATEKARLVHRHTQRLRGYLLRGRMPVKVWQGMSKEPTLAQIRALFTLHMIGPCGLKRFASELDISPASASEMIDKLVEMDMVVRGRDPNNRRQIVIDLTSKARKRTEAHEKCLLERISVLMKKLGPEQSDNWVRLAENIAEVLAQEEHTTK